MKRTIAVVIVFLLLPVQAAAYLPSQFPRTKECGSPARGSLPRRSRRVLQQEALACLAVHRARPSGLVSYRNREHGFSFRHPAAWTVKERLYGTLVSIISPPEADADRIRENINVLLEQLPSAHPSLPEYTAGTLQQLKGANPALTFLTSEGMLLGDNIAAHGVIYEEDTQIGRMKFHQVWAIVGNTALLFTFTATPETFDDYEATFRTVLHTVGVMDP